MSEHRIVGVHVIDRGQAAGDVQKVLGKHSGVIRTRLGLHDVGGGQTSAEGLILLDTLGSRTDVDAMSDELRRLPGVEVQTMVFSHQK
jgi:hypothetical protein